MGATLQFEVGSFVIFLATNLGVCALVLFHLPSMGP